MNDCGFEALILGILQLNQTFPTAGLDSKFYFFVIAIKFFYLFYLFFCSVRQYVSRSVGWCLPRNCGGYPGGSASRTTTKASCSRNRAASTTSSFGGGLRHPCVVCLDAEAIFIALFCCHVSAVRRLRAGLHANRVVLVPLAGNRQSIF